MDTASQSNQLTPMNDAAQAAIAHLTHERYKAEMEKVALEAKIANLTANILALFKANGIETYGSETDGSFTYRAPYEQRRLDQAMLKKAMLKHGISADVVAGILNDATKMVAIKENVVYRKPGEAR